MQVFDISKHPYNTAYQGSFDNALKARQADERMRYYRSEEAYKQFLMGQSVQREVEKARTQAILDAEANRAMNEYAPPAAEAVAGDPNDPNAEAWARRANALRDRALRDSGRAPGPSQPYTGGQKLLPQTRMLNQPDRVAMRQEDRQTDSELMGLRKETDAMRRNLSQYLNTDVDTITGLDSVNEKGYHDPAGGNVAIAASGWRSQVKPDFAKPGSNPIRSIEQIMEQYRTYGAKKDRLQKLTEQKAPLGISLPAGGPATQGGQPLRRSQPSGAANVPAGARVQQGGKTYEKQPDGRFIEVTS